MIAATRPYVGSSATVRCFARYAYCDKSDIKHHYVGNMHWSFWLWTENILLHDSPYRQSVRAMRNTVYDVREALDIIVNCYALVRT